MPEYTNDPQDGECYRGIYRKVYPDWVGWKEIDRHKDMFGFPDNLKFSNVLQDAYQQYIKRPPNNQIFSPTSAGGE